MLALRDDLQVMAKRSGEEKKLIQKSVDEERYKLGLELTALRSEIEDAKKSFSQVVSDEELLRVELDELNSRYRTLAKERQVLENQVSELTSQKSLTEGQIKILKSDSLKFEHEKSRIQRELSQLQIKLLDCENHIKERHEEAHLELENYKREERAKMTAEKTVYLSEVEAFKQKSLIEVENEYRKKQEDLHQQKIICQENADAILKEARLAENQITSEATARLRQATVEAHEREIQSHNRIKEAQEYFKAKEIEADALIQKSRLDSRDYLKKTEFDLLEDLSKRKSKIKKFLTMKQEIGLAHIKMANEQHNARMRREEEKALQRLEEIKRKELKKVARIRDEELNVQKIMKDAVAKELKVEQGKALEHIHLLKQNQEAELAAKKKTLLEHLNSTKTRQQKNWEEEIKREKELFARSKNERILNATQAVMNVLVASNVGATENEQALKDKIRSTLEMAIDGQNADAMRDVEQILDFNPMKRKKILPVIKKFSLQVGIPAAIAIVILTDAGSFRSSIVNISKNLMKQRQSASEMYVKQQKNDWKEKHTFNPATTVGYKPTYTENILYTTDFEKVMDNEEFQNDWILKVHDYMVKELELSEDMAINYISAEGTLLKELAVMKKDLHPQFLEVGLKKLTDLEKAHLGWLAEKIVDPLKLEKFASFRKEYYDDFYQKKFLVSRGVANEVKP